MKPPVDSKDGDSTNRVTYGETGDSVVDNRRCVEMVPKETRDETMVRASVTIDVQQETQWLENALSGVWLATQA